MRFQITGAGWPLDGGARLCPSGTIIDYSQSDTWTQHARGKGIPITATPLDDEAWQAQLAAYPYHRHLLGPGPPSK
jgi:hypothetical protein